MAQRAGRLTQRGTIQAAAESRGLVAGAGPLLCQRHGVVTLVWYGDKVIDSSTKLAPDRHSCKPAAKIFRGMATAADMRKQHESMSQSGASHPRHHSLGMSQPKSQWRPSHSCTWRLERLAQTVLP